MLLCPLEVPFKICGIYIHDEEPLNVCENWESDFESHSESDFSGFDSVSES